MEYYQMESTSEIADDVDRNKRKKKKEKKMF